VSGINAAEGFGGWKPCLWSTTIRRPRRGVVAGSDRDRMTSGAGLLSIGVTDAPGGCVVSHRDIEELLAEGASRSTTTI
jgi:hypothetical protein